MKRTTEIKPNKIVNPNTTSNVEFHNKYNIIMTALILMHEIITITDIIKKKVSKHKKNFNNRLR